MIDSFPPWWCHPVTAPASVVAVPAQVPSPAIA